MEPESDKPCSSDLDFIRGTQSLNFRLFWQDHSIFTFALRLGIAATFNKEQRNPTNDVHPSVFDEGENLSNLSSSPKRIIATLSTTASTFSAR